MVSEGFQSGFRGVSEWSETVWFQRVFRVVCSFRVVWNRVVSEWFQSGSKPCGFRVVSEWSETVWFQRGFREVWIYWRDVAINFQKSSFKIIQWKIIPNFYWEIARMKLSKKHFGRIAIFHSKNLLGEVPKNLRSLWAKASKQKNHTSFYWENTTKRNIEKTMWQNCLISKKKISLERGCNKMRVSMRFASWGCRRDLRNRKRVCRSASVDFHALLGLVGGICGAEKGHAFWTESVDFYALFGLVGGVCGAEKGHVWSKSVDFHALLGLVGGICGAEKGHVWSKSVDFMPFLRFLREAAAWKKSEQFEVLEWRWRKLLFDLSPILAHFGAPRRPAGLQFELRREESPRLGSNRRPERGLLATISRFIGI